MATGRRTGTTRGPIIVLPDTGRDEVPECPYQLGDAGRSWWEWAWRTPPATRWNVGDLYGVARRALLEDRLRAAATKPTPSARTIADLSSLALRCDDALGLTPKGRKALGWKDSPSNDASGQPADLVDLDAFRSTLGSPDAP